LALGNRPGGVAARQMRGILYIDEALVDLHMVRIYKIILLAPVRYIQTI